ncbi:VOC family protein [Streptomyces sp. 4F14]|uniref:VOC family protein n=1 Tax=Streptomyces sp. 4F14 TaxID=3394380 RepID=UPI003A8728BA
MSLDVQITFDAHDPGALAEFWQEVLGYVYPAPPGVLLADGDDARAAWDAFLAKAGVPKEEWNDKSALVDPEGRGPRLFFQRVPEGKSAKNRVHLDVRAAPGLEGEDRTAALEAKGADLVALGATLLRRFEAQPPFTGGFLVMADPEGNEFCLD